MHDEATLVYDGDCAFCRRCVAVMRRVVPRPPSAVPWQSAPLETLGLTREQCDAALQWVRGDDVRSGAAAVAAVLRHGGGPWPVAGALLDAPVVRSVAAMVYQWVAGRRACLIQPPRQPIER